MLRGSPAGGPRKSQRPRPSPAWRVATPNAPNAIGPYSQAIRAGKTLYRAGQIAIDPNTNQLMSKCSHIAVPALDGLADHRCRDLIGDLDVPHFAFALRGEVGEQLRDY